MSAVVMQEFRTTFERFGLPETVDTDDGTCFVSSEFEEFLQKNGIRHITSTPYHPASNGLVERGLCRLLKKGSTRLLDMLMCCYPTGSYHKELRKVLLWRYCLGGGQEQDCT